MLNKFIFNDSGTLSDKTLVLEDYHSGAAVLAFGTGDQLYIGSRYPITRKYFQVSSANVGAAVLAIRYWDGNAWRSAVNVQDGTASAGVPLAVSGMLQWETDKLYAWSRDDTVVSGAEHVTGLGAVTLYDFYWLEISYSAAVTATATWAGDLLCTDAQLGDEYPDLVRANVMEAFEANKTDWKAQCIVASRLVSQDLKPIWSKAGAATVLEVSPLSLAAVTKTAEIIFRGLGGGYSDSEKAAQVEYKSRMNPHHFLVDTASDGRADVTEIVKTRVVRLSR